MLARSMEDESDEAEEHGGIARLRVRLSKIHRSEFEKPKSKKKKNLTDPPKGILRGSRIRLHGGGGVGIAVIERKNLKRDRHYKKLVF